MDKSFTAYLCESFSFFNQLLFANVCEALQNFYSQTRECFSYSVWLTWFTISLFISDFSSALLCKTAVHAVKQLILTSLKKYLRMYLSTLWVLMYLITFWKGTYYLVLKYIYEKYLMFNTYVLSNYLPPIYVMSTFN